MTPRSPVHRHLPGSADTSTGSFLDRVARVDRVSQHLQGTAKAASNTPAERVITPSAARVMTVPISAWVLSSWYDLKSARTGDPRDPYAADGALRVGIAVAVLAGATGIAQFLYTRDETRRETAVHAALNNGAFTLYLLSLGLRRTGRRRLARTVSATAVGIVAASGYLGGDLSYRHGVGVTGTRG